MKKKWHVQGYLEKVLNRFKLREKLLGLFIFCVIIPLIGTDGLILMRIIQTERNENLRDAQRMAESVETLLNDSLENCEKMAVSLEQNRNVEEFIGKEYTSSYEYYQKYYEMTKNNFFQTLVGYDNTEVVVYSDNDSLLNGGYVGRLDNPETQKWYKRFDLGNQNILFVCYSGEVRGVQKNRRAIAFIERLDFNNNHYENYIRISPDYTTFARKIVELGHDRQIYVCDGNTILFSNTGMNNVGEKFETLPLNVTFDVDKELNLYGNLNRIVVVSEEPDVFKIIQSNLPIILLLLLINVLLPAICLLEIDYSIVHRIQKLDAVFGKREEDELVKIQNPSGNDEIGRLMNNYNEMVDQINNLIQIVYKDRLQEQEVNLAKKNAELLALQSQINPHFMFNALESIRMHSIIKKEDETAEMVEKLAIMERQYVEWGSDLISIENEMNSVEAYLGLQKYRFGEKLKYEVTMEEACISRRIPKLTIVTFVENACVHGMENKHSDCWVFVRVYVEKEQIVIEVEDTGTGMEEEKVLLLREKARTIELDDLKNMSHVGIYNALLRLKMTMGEQYEFGVDSEEGVGTMIQIRIPYEEEFNA